MRSSLDRPSAPLVTIDEEVRLVRDYLEIERVRFGDRLRFSLEISDDVRDGRIPRLALQTLVENSVKYAISTRRDGGTITVGAMRADDGIRLTVEDDGPGFEAGRLPEGHGLALLKSRLAMNFGEDAMLRIDSRPGRTVVTIDLRGSAIHS